MIINLGQEYNHCADIMTSIYGLSHTHTLFPQVGAVHKGGGLSPHSLIHFGYATLMSCKNSETEHVFCRWFPFLQVLEQDFYGK